jgi:putative DNA methylase
VVSAFPKRGLPPGAVYLSCGNSASTDLPDECVDLVVTDPPFFDNVHYSELADFFYVWQRGLFSGRSMGNRFTTRHIDEVQDTDAGAFAEKLKAVFVECHRVLRDDGRLVFSYHHSREDGWMAIAQAVAGASFSLIQSQPVKSEMSVAAPKSQAKEPIDLDVLLVCVKRSRDERPAITGQAAMAAARSATYERVSRFNKTGRRLSRNDVRVILLSQLLVGLSAARNGNAISDELDRLLPASQPKVEEIWQQQTVSDDAASRHRARPVSSQLLLFGRGSAD